MVRFGYRDYDPYAGRWTAKDPIFFKGGQGNLFGYVQNNPINRIDPSGTTFQEIEVAIKMALPVVLGGLHVTDTLPNSMGYNLLDIASGASSIFLAETMLVGAPSLPLIFPFVGAFVGGVEVGIGFNGIYEQISGQALGADIYDWTHPQTPTTKRPCN